MTQLKGMDLPERIRALLTNGRTYLIPFTQNSFITKISILFYLNLKISAQC